MRRDWRPDGGDGPHALALTCPVTCGGGVFSWGRNGKGELGLGQAEAGLAPPRRVLGGVLARRTSPLLHIACGAHYCLVAGAQADDVVGWGDGSKLQLGPTPRGGDGCLLYTSPSPRDRQKSRMPSSA